MNSKLLLRIFQTNREFRVELKLSENIGMDYSLSPELQMYFYVDLKKFG